MLAPESEQIDKPGRIKPRNETWIDWLKSVPLAVAMASAQPLLSKDELLSRLAEAGIKVSARDLVYWQQRGTVPYPTKRRENRTTTATYPAWMPSFIQTLREEQEVGIDLDTIAADLRHLVEGSFIDPFGEQARASHARQIAYREFSRRTRATIPPLAMGAKLLETILDETIGTVRITFNPLKPGEDPRSIRFEFEHSIINPTPDAPKGTPTIWKLGFVDRSDLDHSK